MSYVDPGTTSYLFQLVMATVLGIFLAFRQAFTALLRRLFAGKRSSLREEEKAENE